MTKDNLKFEEIRERQNALRYQLIVNELDLAVTFFHIARATTEPERLRRNLRNAEEALGNAWRLFQTTKLTASMRREIRDRIRNLEPLFGLL